MRCLRRLPSRNTELLSVPLGRWRSQSRHRYCPPKVIKGYILLIFYTSGKCWQFRVISPDGSVYGSEKIFYTSVAAREAQVSWVGGGK